ncbi:Na+/H+ antiporter NhaA [Streptacidiphilus sp. ASG 303]|uniref:Na+/H+ antiporter NhaA n=1 Tax=Streptomycetaceae TaxID=2062 RepID=UPI001E3FB7EE|nr:Na+/H+ antiporter NhaA [Streptacidiphilus sp. ASG 303]MCD0482422.1 Na+/H+ antiporter NhaA [Streptacidiphilus sp. ASG 303]
MATAPPRRSGPRQLFGLLSLPERNFVVDALRTETVGGVLLLAAAVVALLWANVWPHAYESVRDITVGPSGPLHLDLSLEAWAEDGLLTVFFFVAGIELKRELVAGDLRDPKAAALPVVAAVCGMAVPALVYAGVNLGGGHLHGWAIPTATDIAFALGVLAVVGTHLPSALRAFLLTLAVVDDLGAILVIAVLYTSAITLWALLGAAAGLVLFGVLHRRRVRGWYVYVPLGVAVWALMHESGVHATVAGVAMGLLLRCTRDEGEDRSPAERIEHRVRPFSAGFCVPVFALFAAGVAVSPTALGQVFTEAAPLGVVLGLAVGKVLGVFGGTWLAARFTRAELNPSLRWSDLYALATLAGIGFTVSLLISELAFPGDPELAARAKAAVLVGSLFCALLASVLLRLRNRHYRQLWEDEERDEDHDGIPDVYQVPESRPVRGEG